MATALTKSNTSIVLSQPIPADQHPAAVYLASLSPGSKKTMRGALEMIAGLISKGRADAVTLNWAALRFQHTTAVRAALADRYEAATANKMLSALRGVLKAAWKLDQMTTDDYTRAVDIGGVTGETLPAGRALSLDEIEALLQACARDRTPAGRRDAALIALLRAGGLRRAEVCALKLADYDAGNRTLSVKGKRNKQRLVPLAQAAAFALEDWLAVRGSRPGALFCPVNKAGKVNVRRVTSQAIYNALAKRAQQAGVAELSPHDFRRTFVSDLLDAGADIATVQRMAGHANIQTTARYDRRGEKAKQAAAELLDVPYIRSEQ